MVASGEVSNICYSVSDMSTRVVKKILPEYFDLIVSGKKKFEFRMADFDIEEGDTLVLEEWDSTDPDTRKPTGRILEKTVTFTKKFDLNDFAQKDEILERGFHIIQFE